MAGESVILTEIQRSGGAVRIESDGATTIAPVTTKNALYKAQGGGVHQFQVGTVVTATINSTGIINQSTVSGGEVSFTIENLSNTASSDAIEIIRTGGAFAGDPYIRFVVNGATNWALGVDNSDADKYKISESTVLGTNDRLIIFIGGNVNIPGKLGLGSLFTAVNDVDINKAAIGANVLVQVFNSDNTNSASASRIYVATGGASAGDAS